MNDNLFTYIKKYGIIFIYHIFYCFYMKKVLILSFITWTLMFLFLQYQNIVHWNVFDYEINRALIEIQEEVKKNKEKEKIKEEFKRKELEKKKIIENKKIKESEDVKKKKSLKKNFQQINND